MVKRQREGPQREERVQRENRQRKFREKEETERERERKRETERDRERGGENMTPPERRSTALVARRISTTKELNDGHEEITNKLVFAWISNEGAAKTTVSCDMIEVKPKYRRCVLHSFAHAG